jgi:hypothetical protein
VHVWLYLVSWLISFLYDCAICQLKIQDKYILWWGEKQHIRNIDIYVVPLTKLSFDLFTCLTYYMYDDGYYKRKKTVHCTYLSSCMGYNISKHKP